MTEKASGSEGQRLPLVLIPLLYYLGAKLSLTLAVMPEALVILWIPNGVLLAILLRERENRLYRFAPLIVLAEVAADLPTFPMAQAALFGAANVMEVSIAFMLLRRWRFDARFATPGDLVKFVIGGPVLSALTSACTGSIIYGLFSGTQAHFGEYFSVWWFSDGLGLLILTPLVVSLWPSVRRPEESARFFWFDGVAVVVSLALLIAFALSRNRMFHGVTVRSFLLIPPVLYVAARFSVRVTAATVTAAAGLLLFVVKNGQQPFGPVPILETVTSAQELIFTISTMSLGIASLLSQQRASARELEARVVERTTALSRANEELQRLSVTDPLTGLLNRRAFIDRFEREMSRERRFERSLALILLDIDHFKDVNDRFGHAAGDSVLRHVAAVSAGLLRSSDTIARYGGEEFAILAPETSEVSALQLAERVRVGLQSTEITADHGVLRVTASFGIAILRSDDHDADQLFRRADEALYAAKAGGRNRVVAHARADSRV